MREERMKPVVWVGDSKKRLKEFPEDVQDEIGFALERAQWGRTHHNAKPMQGFSGVYEIVSDYASNTYRAVYVVNLFASLTDAWRFAGLTELRRQDLCPSLFPEEIEAGNKNP